MDLQKFIDSRDKYPWALEPCLYCILQDAGIKQPDGSFVQNDKYRCGTSGTKMFEGADLAYRAGDSSSTGLISRSNLYIGFFRPFAGKIFAALRVKKALVAEVGRDRTSEDAYGNIFNVDRANTLARVREKEYHAELDRRGMRYQAGRELFRTDNVQNIIAAMRTVRGEEMYIFNETGPIFDEKYRGGSRRKTITITETQPRQNPERNTSSRAPSLTITLSKAFLEQLRSGNPTMFQRLINLVAEFDQEKEKTKTTSIVTVQMDPADVQDVRNQTDRGRAITRGIQQMVRRSPRLAASDDASTETTVTQPPSPTPPRRSARLAQKKK